MNLFKALFGLGFLAGAAVLAVKLIDLFDRTQDVEWTAVMGEMPEGEYTVPAPERAEADGAQNAEAPEAEEPAAPEAEAPAQNAEAPVPEAEEKTPERVTVHPRRARIDPTTIARAEDFQDWDDFGCRG